MNSYNNNPEKDSTKGIDPNIGAKVGKGVLLMITATILARGINIVASLILTRMLTPKEFGIMAIALAIITFSRNIAMTGFGSAIIQKQGDPKEYLNTAWTFELLRYLILSVILYLLAPVIADFFNEESVVLILRVILLGLLFAGIQNIGVVLFRKQLDFKKQFLFDIIPSIVRILVVLPLIFYLRNIWALVWAYLAFTLTTTVLSFILHPYRPRLEFNITKGKELFRYGKWILGSSLLAKIQFETVTMISGKLLGLGPLGYFNRAWTFSTIPFRELYAVFGKVIFPAFSQLQSDVNRFRKAYLDTIMLSAFAIMPLAGGMFVLSGDFVRIFLTEKWLAIIPIIQILSIKAIVRAVNSTTGLALNASGNPKKTTKAYFVGFIVLLGSIYPISLKMGIEGAAFSILLSVTAAAPILLYEVMKLLNIRLFAFLKPVIITILNTSFMVVSLYYLKLYIFTDVKIIEFFELVLFGMILYLFIVLISSKVFKYDALQIIMRKIKNLRK